jgi:hypothetical protein
MPDLIFAPLISKGKIQQERYPILHRCTRKNYNSSPAVSPRKMQGCVFLYSLPQ